MTKNAIEDIFDTKAGMASGIEPLECWYYRCDDSWHIAEEYPKNQIYSERRNDMCILWYWEIREDGAFTVTNIWNHEQVTEGENISTLPLN